MAVGAAAEAGLVPRGYYDAYVSGGCAYVSGGAVLRAYDYFWYGLGAGDSTLVDCYVLVAAELCVYSRGELASQLAHRPEVEPGCVRGYSGRCSLSCLWYPTVVDADDGIGEDA